MPSYFDAWDPTDDRAAGETSGDWARVVDRLYKYLNAHSRTFREQREQTLTRRERLVLFSEKEAPFEHELRAQRSLLTAYQWHMVSSRRQADALRALMDSKSTTLPLGDTLVTYDWREKLKLPLAPVESGAMWHAQQKVSLSCWGGAVFRHSETSSPAEPQLSTTYIFYVTDVVEQTAEASNLMLGEALKEVNVPTSGSLHLWSDTGPHYRSAENLYYYARTLPEQRKQKVFIRWLAEQHGKGVLDQQFGLSGTHNNGWIGMYARKHPIFTIGDMVEALKQGAEHQMKKDPTGPRYIVRQIEYPKHKSAVRQFLYADSLKITRTYALDAEPSNSSRNFPPVLYNAIFADSSTRSRISDWRVDTLQREQPEEWRRNFFEGVQEWMSPPPDPHADSHLKRVWQAQKNCRPPRALLPERNLEEKIAAQQARQARAKQKLARRLEYLRNLQDGAEGVELPSSGSSSDSENSSSSSSSSGS